MIRVENYSAGKVYLKSPKGRLMGSAVKQACDWFFIPVSSAYSSQDILDIGSLLTRLNAGEEIPDGPYSVVQ